MVELEELMKLLKVNNQNYAYSDHPEDITDVSGLNIESRPTQTGSRAASRGPVIGNEGSINSSSD